MRLNEEQRAEKHTAAEQLPGDRTSGIAHRIVICDDVCSDRRILREIIERFLVERGERADIAEYAACEAMLADLEEDYCGCDLFFLDIYMKGKSGMSAAYEMREKGLTSPIVFFTTSADFAVESYDVQASGYLVKPINEEKLCVLLERLLVPAERPRICLRCKGRMRYFFVDELAWVESYKHMLVLHFGDGSTVHINEKMGNIEEKLNDSRFLRCHQSYLINMDYVADVQEDFIMKDQSRVPIRVRTRKKIIDTYHSYFITHVVSRLPKEDVYV